MRVFHLGYLPFAPLGTDTTPPYVDEIFSIVTLSDVQYMQQYWAVKKWRVTISLDDGTDSSTGTYDFDALNTSRFDLVGPPTNEHEIGLFDTTTFSTANQSPSFGIFWTPFFSGYVDGAWRIAIQLSANPNYLSTTQVRTGPNPPVDANLKTSAVVGTFMGQPFALFELLAFDLTGSISIDPLEYWTYAKADHSRPIYDDEGNQLLPPVQNDE